MSAIGIQSGVRFAPSPTGRFHVGNLRTAWISEQLARGLGQAWIVRVEDLDPLRSKSHFWSMQQSDLHKLGLVADQIVWQRERLHVHRQSLQQAFAEGRIYPCNCSRREVLEALASAPHEPEAIYNGKCRLNPPRNLHENVGWRWKFAEADGHRDPLIARGELREVEPAYHWACAIDDADGGYQVLVRAIDLLSAEPIQREIRIWRRPDVGAAVRVFHTALVVQDDGSRLEKRTQGVTLDELKISVDQLLEAFHRSFDRDAALASLRQAPELKSETPPVLREAASQLRLRELLG
ncbi:MAG TPA: glutamate--tRNA ligase family protein [Pseudobdellovibrionaceae bacterium]|nr:glutamate--tRNA ligase family protein [Pseudobdellovibrionaceae bacterium]